MKEAAKRWSAADLVRVLALAQEKLSTAPLPAAPGQTSAAAPSPSVDDDVPGPALRRAAVLSRFRFDALAPAAAEIERLRSFSVPVRGEGEGWRSLLPEARSSVLGRLPREEIHRLLEADPQPNDPLQQGLRAALAGFESGDLSSLTASSLAALVQVHEGLSRVIPELPPRSTIERKLELARLLDPMRRMTSTFSGREQELQQLRDYVGVLPPSSWIGAAKRLVAATFFSQRQPAFLIAGPGGVGKTTLVSRFILEHALVGHELQFPFAYLDFDRPTVNAQEPATLLVEAVRQIELQYEAAALSGQQLRQRWEQQLSSEKTRAHRSGVPLGDLILDDFASFLTTLAVGDGPVLLVLDTFEEVQLRSSSYAKRTLELIGQLSTRIPRLRVVIAGRAEVPGVKFFDTILLKEFDRMAAVGYLQAKGVDQATAELIAKEVGGSPLALTVAIAFFQRDPEGIRAHGLGLDGVALHSGVVQAQLFDRILLHIGDEDVRRLAHPGLVLRRVTAELIRVVLAKPCGVDVPDDMRARELFEKLKEDLTLFVPGENPAVLLHRPDLRKLMLRPLRHNAPRQVEEIHRAAAEFYAGQRAKRASHAEELVARAEEVYHRLALGESRETIGAIGRELEPYLASAIEELAPPEQAILAEALGLELPPEALKEADQETWERAASRHVRELMETGDLQTAAAMVRERSERSTATDLRVAEVALLDRMGKIEEARKVADDGIGAARRDGRVRLLASLLLAAADLEATQGELNLAGGFLAEAEELGRAGKDAFLLMRVLAARGKLARAEGEDAAEIGRELAAIAARTTDAEWSGELPLLRAVVAEAGAEDGGLVRRAQRLGALNLTASQREWLGKARIDYVADPDRPLPQMDGAARGLGAPGAEALADFFDFESLGAEIADDKRLVALLQEEQRERIRGQAPNYPSEAKPVARRSRLKLKDADRQQLTDLIFQKIGAGLGSFLESGLSRGLEAVTFFQPGKSQVQDVLKAAETEGWLDQLIVALLHSRFDDPDLLHFCDRLGLGPTLVEASSAAALPEKTLLSLFTDHRGKVGALQARICTVEVGEESRGCGFLVGPDLVLTASEVAPRDLAPRDISLRFDRVVVGGHAIAPGRVVGLARKLPIRNEVDYSLLRLETSQGSHPVDRTDPEARIRGFLSWPELPTAPASPQALLWLWRDPHGTHLSGIAQPKAGSLDRVEVAMAPAALGAPIFDQNFEVVALTCHRVDRKSSRFLPLADVQL